MDKELSNCVPLFATRCLFLIETYEFHNDKP